MRGIVKKLEWAMYGTVVTVQSPGSKDSVTFVVTKYDEFLTSEDLLGAFEKARAARDCPEHGLGCVGDKCCCKDLHNE